MMFGRNANVKYVTFSTCNTPPLSPGADLLGEKSPGRRQPTTASSAHIMNCTS